MKRFLTLSFFLLAFVLISGDLFAYGSRRSLGYVRNMAKNATVDHADAAIYNPAGTVKLDDGIYVDLTNQMAYKKYSAKLTTALTGATGLPLHGLESVDEKPVWLNPSVVLMYKKGKGAVWFDFTVPAGGGSVSYKSSGIDNLRGLSFVPYVTGSPAAATKFVGDSSTLAFSVSASYQPFDWVSVAAGLRYTNGSGSVVAGAGFVNAIKLSYNQDGWTGYASINFYPIDALVIAAAFQPEVRMRGKMSVKHDGITVIHDAEVATWLGHTVTALGLTYGGIGEQTVDGKIYVGIGYDVTEDLNVQVAFDYGLSKQQSYVGNPFNVSIDPATADYDAIVAALSASTLNTKKRDGYTISAGAEYQIGMFRPSLSFAYDKTGDTPRSNTGSPWDPGLNSWLVSAGLAVTPVEWLEISVGVLKTFYEPTSSGPASGFLAGRLNFEKDAWVYGIGITAKFLSDGGE